MMIITGLLCSLLMQVSAFQISLNKKASWSEALNTHLISPILSSFSPLPTGPEEKTLNTIELNSEADWRQAWEKNLHRQSLYNNIVKEVFNSFTRILGWHLISLVLYELLSLGRSATSRARHLNIRKIREINHPNEPNKSVLDILEEARGKYS